MKDLRGFTNGVIQEELKSVVVNSADGSVSVIIFDEDYISKVVEGTVEVSLHL